MSGRQLKKLLLFAAAIAVGYWIYRDRPTLSGLVDRITSPLMGSRAAVKTSERKRVVGDATVVITEQTEQKLASLREGMRGREVRELLGDPDSVERVVEDGVRRVRWDYKRVGREIVLEEDRVVSIVIR